MRNISFYGLILLILINFGCERYDDPTVTVLEPIVEEIGINESIVIGFEIIADAGYHSSEVNAEKGTVIHRGDIGQDAVQGVIYVKYTASSELGNDIITFTIKDNDGNHASTKVEINVIEN